MFLNRLKDKKLKPIYIDIFNMIILTVLVFIFSSWVLNKNNFFIFDDYHNLVLLPYVNFSDIMVILPNSAYCSRPVGWIIVKILLEIFGLNYMPHAIFMLLIHSLNAILLYLCCNKIFKNMKYNRIFSFIAAVIFAIYPVSTMPSYWEASMFDLFGTTLILACLSIFLIINNMQGKGKKHIIKKIALSIIMIVLYYMSLRAKEMFIALPVLLFCYSLFSNFFDNKNEKETIKDLFKRFNLKEFIIKNIYLIVMIVIMLAYFIYSRVLNTTNQYTNNINDAYYYIFDLKVMLVNLFKYTCMYFNPISLLYGDVTEIIHYGLMYKINICIFSAVIIGVAIYKFIKGKYINMFFIFGYFALIIPVLPMPNLHAIWYLYAPAIFLASIVAITIYDLISLVGRFIKNEKIIGIICKISLVIIIVLLIVINNLGNIKDFRKWWLDYAFKYKNSYEYLLELKDSYPDAEKVYVINVPDEYTVFYIGPGFIVNVAFDNPDLPVEVNKYDYDLNNENVIVIDYNNYDFVLLNE